MKIFINLKKEFKHLGIEPDQPDSFNWINIVAVFLFLFCFSAMSVFVLFEADNILDLGNSFYGLVCAFLNACTLSSIVMKKSNIFKLINRFEDIIMKRK